MKFVTPFQETGGRLHSFAASLLVILAAELLKWQNPAVAAGAMLGPLALGWRKSSSVREAPLPAH
jgi:hypothetical protein